MSYDGIVTHSVVSELNKTILGGKIDKVYQPEKNDIVLSVRTFSGNYKLLLSASASNARVHLTSQSYENPMVPPVFCMLLRKHLQGGKIIAVSQIEFDRVLRIDVETRNELGDLCVRSIIIEIMGRHSNIILIQEDNKIMDCAKHVDFTVSAVRQVLPGLYYEAPPTQDKISPESADALSLLNKLEACGDDMLLDKFLLSEIEGLSPLIAREIVYGFKGNTTVTKSEISTAHFITYVCSFLVDICKENYSPSIVFDGENKPIAFSCVKLSQYSNSAKVEPAPSISEAIDTYFDMRAKRERMEQRSASLIKLVGNNISRCEKKLAMHRDNIEKSKKRETYKIYGDLITANIYRIEYGMKSVRAENYYSDPIEEIEIPLKENIGPAQNAQRYYKLYNKAKSTEKYALEQIASAEEELEYLETVLDSLKRAESTTVLSEIRDELADGGYLPKNNNKNKKHQAKAEPRKFISSDGYEILVGRNNVQNDILTIKMAYSTDIWLHTKNIPGSHTIIRTRGEAEVPDKTIVEAAALAAYFSKAQNSSKVPVDYVTVKNVKKPNGAKPGMVIYDHYSTVYVDPALLKTP